MPVQIVPSIPSINRKFVMFSSVTLFIINYNRRLHHRKRKKWKSVKERGLPDKNKLHSVLTKQKKMSKHFLWLTIVLSRWWVLKVIYFLRYIPWLFHVSGMKAHFHCWHGLFQSNLFNCGTSLSDPLSDPLTQHPTLGFQERFLSLTQCILGLPLSSLLL